MRKETRSFGELRHALCPCAGQWHAKPARQGQDGRSSIGTGAGLIVDMYRTGPPLSNSDVASRAPEVPRPLLGPGRCAEGLCRHPGAVAGTASAADGVVPTAHLPLPLVLRARLRGLADPGGRAVPRLGARYWGRHGTGGVDAMLVLGEPIRHPRLDPRCLRGVARCSVLDRRYARAVGPLAVCCRQHLAEWASWAAPPGPMRRGRHLAAEQLGCRLCLGEPCLNRLCRIGGPGGWACAAGGRRRLAEPGGWAVLPGTSR